MPGKLLIACLRPNWRACWLTAPVEVHLYFVVVSPQIHLPASELGAVVAGDSLQQSSGVFQAINGGDNLSSSQTEYDIDRQTLTGEQIDDGQRADLPSVG
jgi:hypothetical protein